MNLNLYECYENADILDVVNYKVQGSIENFPEFLIIGGGFTGSLMEIRIYNR